MPERAAEGRRTSLQVVVIALLVAGYGALGAYFHLALHVHIVYTHAGYIPIVLASMWWGRRGVVAAGLVACLPVCFHLLGLASAPLWSDAARIFFF